MSSTSSPKAARRPDSAAVRSSTPRWNSRTRRIRPVPSAPSTASGCTNCCCGSRARRELREPEVLADQLALLYDAAMVGTQLDGRTTPALRARAAASALVTAAAPRVERHRQRHITISQRTASQGAVRHLVDYSSTLTARTHVKKRIRPAVVVHRRPPFDSETAGAIERDRVGVLLIDRHRQIAPQSIGVRHQSPAEASPQHVGLEEQRLHVMTRESHESQWSACGRGQHPQFAVRREIIAHRFT